MTKNTTTHAPFARGLLILAALAATALLALASPASAIGPIGTGQNVTLADGTKCNIFVSVGKTYGQPVVSSGHSVRCDARVTSLSVESKLRQTSGGSGFASASETRFDTGFYSKTLSVPYVPGTYAATNRATIEGQTFEVTSTRTVPAGVL